MLHSAQALFSCNSSIKGYEKKILASCVVPHADETMKNGLEKQMHVFKAYNAVVFLNTHRNCYTNLESYHTVICFNFGHDHLHLETA